MIATVFTTLQTGESVLVTAQIGPARVIARYRPFGEPETSMTFTPQTETTPAPAHYC